MQAGAGEARTRARLSGGSGERKSSSAAWPRRRSSGADLLSSSTAERRSSSARRAGGVVGDPERVHHARRRRRHGPSRRRASRTRKADRSSSPSVSGTLPAAAASQQARLRRARALPTAWRNMCHVVAALARDGLHGLGAGARRSIPSCATSACSAAAAAIGRRGSARRLLARGDGPLCRARRVPSAAGVRFAAARAAGRAHTPPRRNRRRPALTAGASGCSVSHQRARVGRRVARRARGDGGPRRHCAPAGEQVGARCFELLEDAGGRCSAQSDARPRLPSGAAGQRQIDGSSCERYAEGVERWTPLRRHVVLGPNRERAPAPQKTRAREA